MRRKTKIIVGVAGGVLGLWACARTAFEGWFINGMAMSPTYNHGDLLIAYKFAYASPRDVKRGDVVVVRYRPRGFEERQIWRVGGVPGDEVVLPDGSRSKLAADEFFLRGDNPEGSLDSRTFGAVSFSSIEYKILGRLRRR